MGLRSLVLVALLWLPAQSLAATITVGPSDCSAAAVNAGITAAADGDTVLLTCTGSVTWSSAVSIPNTKGITLAVQGGTNTPKGSATFPLTVVSSVSGSHTLKLTAGPNKKLSRITGFKFRNPGVTAPDSGFLWVSGCGKGTAGLGSFRIDNNYFDTISGNTIIGVRSSCPELYGLFDNNTLHDPHRSTDENYGPYAFQVWNDFKAGTCWGGGGWTDPFIFGDANWVFVEDNLFENVTSGLATRHSISHEEGGRSVVRYNDFYSNATSPSGGENDVIEGHGLCLCSSNGAGVRGAEVYGNVFRGNNMNRVIMPRGGTWLIYDNAIQNAWNSAYPSPIMLMEYRAGSSGMYNQCSSSCPCTTPWFPICTDVSNYPLAQQVSGTFTWNNLYLGVNRVPAVDPGGVQPLYIQEGRDYFPSATKPAALSWYTPFTYPHPLRNSSPPPNSPLSVVVQ